MANNMYAYNDYNGPGIEEKDQPALEESDDENPLQIGMWLEGDSLAPPCGSTLSLITQLLDLAFNDIHNCDLNNDKNVIFYDLGCGDGRVCLEAYWNFVHSNKSKGKIECVGVEIEEDLVERFQFLIDQLPKNAAILPISEKGEKYGSGTFNSASCIHAVHGDLCELLDYLLKRQKDTVKDNDGIDINASSETVKYPDGKSRFSNLPIPNIITMYLIPEAIKLIEPQLVQMLKLFPNLRIVCNTWGLKGVEAFRTFDCLDEKTGCDTKLFLYCNDCLKP